MTVLDRDDEAGMAMITAILVSLVVLFLGFVATGLSDHSFSSTRVDQKRVTTFHAAEGGIDHALRVLQTTARASLPCAAPLARSLGGGAYAPDYVVTFTYYSTFPVAGAAMACPLAAEPAAVVLRSTGGSSDPLGSDRAVEAVARLTVPPAFPHTVFSDQTIDYDGPVKLAGDAMQDAEVYTNGGLNCDQPESVFATFVVQGAASLSNGCSLTGSVLAGGAVSISGNVTVGGDVRSPGAVSVSGASTVSGEVKGATITVDGTSTAPNQNAGAPLALAPTASAFPNVTYDAAAWTTAGYTPPASPPATCAAALTALTTSAASWTGPTLVRVTGCKLTTPAATTIQLNEDVAIIMDGGFEFGASTTFKLTATAPADTRLTLFVPSGSSCASASGRIVMGAATSFAVPLQVFAYTPCLLQAQTSGTMNGQLYGATVRFGGPTTIRHTAVASFPGYVPVSPNVARRVEVTSAPREVTP